MLDFILVSETCKTLQQKGGAKQGHVFPICCLINQLRYLDNVVLGQRNEYSKTYETFFVTNSETFKVFLKTVNFISKKAKLFFHDPF